MPTQLTHHKAIGPPHWSASAETLKLVDEARARGVDGSIDQYPYTASRTGSAAIYPAWVQEGGREKMVARLKDPALRERIKKETIDSIRTNRGGGDPNNVQFAFCKWDTSLNGKTLADVTRERGREVTLANAADTAIEIEIAGGCKTVYHAMNEEDSRQSPTRPSFGTWTGWSEHGSSYAARRVGLLSAGLLTGCASARFISPRRHFQSMLC